MSYDRRLLDPLARRAYVSPDTIERFIWDDPVSQRLMVHADRALRRRHRWLCRYALDKVADRFYRQRQRPFLTEFIEELEAA